MSYEHTSSTGNKSGTNLQPTPEGVTKRDKLLHIKNDNRAYSLKLEYDGWTDRRLSDRRETAISIIRLAEKVCNGNGGGKLLVQHCVEEMSIYSFSDHERWIIKRPTREFRRELARAGFLPIPEHWEGEAG